jgi:hypothetical protein
MKPARNAAAIARMKARVCDEASFRPIGNPLEFPEPKAIRSLTASVDIPTSEAKFFRNLIRLLLGVSVSYTVEIGTWH